MVCWLTTSTVAGVSWTARPSRLALPATTLLLSGVGAASVVGCGTGLAAGLRAARLARFGVSCCSPPACAAFGFGGDTTTGSSVPDCACTDVVTKRSDALEMKTTRRRDGTLNVWMLK